MVKAMDSIRTLPLLMIPQSEGCTPCYPNPPLPELITEADDITQVYSHVADALAAVIELYEDMQRPLPDPA